MSRSDGLSKLDEVLAMQLVHGIPISWLLTVSLSESTIDTCYAVLT